jgi:hypothetical protein
MALQMGRREETGRYTVGTGTLPRVAYHSALSERDGALVRRCPVATQAMRCVRTQRHARPRSSRTAPRAVHLGLLCERHIE